MVLTAVAAAADGDGATFSAHVSVRRPEGHIPRTRTQPSRSYRRGEDPSLYTVEQAAAISRASAAHRRRAKSTRQEMKIGACVWPRHERSSHCDRTTV